VQPVRVQYHYYVSLWAAEAGGAQAEGACRSQQAHKNAHHLRCCGCWSARRATHLWRLCSKASYWQGQDATHAHPAQAQDKL